MTRPPARAAFGTTLFLFLAPGVVAGVIPWWLTGWDSDDIWAPVRVLGGALIVVGAAVLLHGFARLVVEGLGTRAPIAPPERLVIGGLYRYVRNPMYLAVGATAYRRAVPGWWPRRR